MKKEIKCSTKQKNDAQQSTKKSVKSPRIVTGAEIPNLLKNRPFKIRFY